MEDLRLTIRAEQGLVVITHHKKGLVFNLPTGMLGKAYDDFRYENKAKIKKFRKLCKG